MLNNKNTFIDFLVASGALRFGDFTTKSGRQSPYFVNTGEFKTGASISTLASFYASTFVKHFAGQADNLFGPAYKGIPLCAATALKLAESHQIDLSFTYNRKEVKDHGEGGLLVGDTYKSPKNVVIIEDVITAGTSIHESMEFLSKIKGVNVLGLIVSVDRKEKLESGLSAIQTVQEKYNIKAYSIIDIDDIIQFLKDDSNRQKINVSESILDKIYQYREKWGLQNVSH